MRRRFGATAAAVIVALVSMAGCGPNICDGDRPGVQNALASTEAWLRVVDLPEGVPAGDGTLTIEMSVVPVGPGRSEGRERQDTIEVHDSFADDIESGLDAGADVYLALISVGSRKSRSGPCWFEPRTGSTRSAVRAATGDMTSSGASSPTPTPRSTVWSGYRRRPHRADPHAEPDLQWSLSEGLARSFVLIARRSSVMGQSIARSGSSQRTAG